MFPTLGVWYYLAVTFTPNGIGGGLATLYASNPNASPPTGAVQVAQETRTVAPAAVTYTHDYIGQSNWSSHPHFQGGLQDVEFYQSALSSTRIHDPYLYIGTDGLLRGEFWNGSVEPITSKTSVTDGNWHYAVLTSTGVSQSLYLDGAILGTIVGPTTSLDMILNPLAYGNTTGWPCTATAGCGASMSFVGQMQDFAVYNKALAGPSVTAHYAAASAPVPANSTDHRIRITIQQLVANGSVSLTLPAGAVLKPDYDLPTSTEDADGKITTTLYSNSSGLTPAYGLDTSTTKDPIGLDLTTTNTYEPIGSGYLRQTGETLPAGNTITMSYYGEGSTANLAANPCVSGSASVNQGGALYQRSGPGSNNVTTYVYDEAGDVLASRLNSDGWICATYDSRDRPTQESYPASSSAPNSARTVTYTYNNAGGTNPATTTESDSNGMITTTVDWDDRAVSYTDATGHTTTTAYDQAGRETSTVGPAGTIATAYDNDGRTETVSLNGSVKATPAYDPASLTSSVAYANGTTATFGWDADGRANQVAYTGPSNTALFSDTQVISPAGMTASDAETDNSGSWTDTYTYDNADRLTAATEPGHTYTYSYAPSGGCGILTTAGANSDRTASTDNGATTTYCYSNADRLSSTTAPNHSGITYDTDGNTLTAGTDTLTYDGDRRNLTITSGTTQVTYTRDATGRVINRTVKTNGTVTTNVNYQYSDSSSEPAADVNVLTNVTEHDMDLPGGVTFTMRPNSNNTWSYPNLHGDDVITTNSSGVKIGTTVNYDPFGTPLQTLNDNSAGNYDYGYEGKHEIGTDTDTPITLMQMGERVYDPLLGRFLQVDPIFGGSANNYDYARQDPIDIEDLTGDKPKKPKNRKEKIYLCVASAAGICHIVTIQLVDGQLPVQRR